MLSLQYALCPSTLVYTSEPTSPISNSDSRCPTPCNPKGDDTQIPPQTPAMPLRRQQSHGNLRSDLDMQQRPEDIPLPESDDETLSGLESKPKERIQPLESKRETRPRHTVTKVRSRSDTIAKFATLHQLQHYRQRQNDQLQRQRQDLQISVALSARLIRVYRAAHRGLVECLRLGDKNSFVAIHKTVQDLKDVRGSIRNREFDDAEALTTDGLDMPKLDYVNRLTPKAQDDLSQLLNLARTDPQFLFERLSSLSPSQLSQILASSAPAETTEPTAPRTRSQTFIPKRNSAHLVSIQDRVLAFERSDALSTLLFNLFASHVDQRDGETHLRLETWSTTCAKLASSQNPEHVNLVGHVISAWASSDGWLAKSRFELYLMDILQEGAFLLEKVEGTPGTSPDLSSIDPLHTSVAEEFFESAVQTLFNLLDDTHGGFPLGALELIHAISHKLALPETRLRFRNFAVHGWFFTKFLSNAITNPESHGMLLETHISKDAREKLLAQVAARAQAQVSKVVNSTLHFSIVNPKITESVESILAHLETSSRATKHNVPPTIGSSNSSSGPFLVLCSSDLLNLIDSLYPSLKPSPQPWESIPTLRNPTDSISTLPIRGKFGARKFEVPFQREGLGLDTFSMRQPASSIFTDPTKIPDITLNPGPADPFTQPPVADPFLKAVESLRWELVHISDPDPRPHTSSPFGDDWAVLELKDNKVVKPSDPHSGSNRHSPDLSTQHPRGTPDEQYRIRSAILRLAEDQDLCSIFAQEHADRRSMDIETSFQEAVSFYHKQSNFTEAHYWWQTRELFRRLYPFSNVRNEDYGILQPLAQSSEQSIEASVHEMKDCESALISLNRLYDRFNRRVKEVMGVLDGLRTKIWYMTEVKNSKRYEEARNVALALKSMTLSSLNQPQPVPEVRSRLGSRGLLQRPEAPVLSLMKASHHQGGPYKLADDQVELTRKWLEQSGIDNFCVGEERIHRFCYEVKASVNSLIGENLVDGPVLWSSEFFYREKNVYDAPSRGMSGSLGGRPSSMISDDYSSASQSFSAGARPWEYSTRPQDSQPSLAHRTSYQSLASDKWRSQRDTASADTTSLNDSPGRTISASTADSFHQFWSPLATQAHSLTSASSYHSRPPSVFSEALTSKKHDRITRAKAAFLESLRHSLTTLLLSDLGSPVWSCGSETDAWFSNVLSQDRFRTQMAKRAKLDDLLMGSPPSMHYTDSSKKQKSQRRRQSLGPDGGDGQKTRSSGRRSRPRSESRERPGLSRVTSTFAYPSALQQLVVKFSYHSNPLVKLKALTDLRELVAQLLLSQRSTPSNPPPTEHASGSRRPFRHSMTSAMSASVLQSDTSETQNYDLSSPDERDIVQYIRDLLQECQPKTLFRDLQFIAAFVPTEILNQSDSGAAFLHVGLAALALKQDVCQSMIEVADRIVSQEINSRHYNSGPNSYYQHPPRPAENMAHAANLWIITAKEGNATAQRELAILYLTHPELCPRVTLPLTKPKDTFKADMMYRRDHDSKADPQSMCLALHWMQLSASGGDPLAQNKLKEREEFELIP